MAIYTRNGDSGETSLANGSRALKSSVRVAAYGAVDEANSAVGHARAAVTDDLLDSVLGFAQQRLFNCGAILATPADAVSDRTPVIGTGDIAFLESAIDRFMEAAGPLRGFVLESGCEVAVRLHVARAVVRRAERGVVALSAEEPQDPEVMRFLNRLSDLLFAAARYANVLEGTHEEPWDPKAEPPSL